MAANAVILLAEMGELVRSTIERSPGSKVRDRITAAAQTLGLPRSRVEDFWYREARNVKGYEVDLIRQNALRARESEIRRMERELDRLRAEFAQMAPLDGIRPAVVARRSSGPGARRRRAEAT